jgi:hypothetical protein
MHFKAEKLESDLPKLKRSHENEIKQLKEKMFVWSVKYLF